MPAPSPSPLRRRSRLAVVSLSASLALVLGVSACGDDTEAAPTTPSGAERLDAVSISGEVGTAPEVTWDDQMEAGDVEAETLTEGDGEAVADGATVMAQLWIGNGFSEQQAFSTYEQGGAELVSNGDDAIPAVAAALDGATIGSRVAVTGSAEAVFGTEAGNPSLGIGNADTVLVVVDVLSAVLDAPDGAASPAPDWAPAIVETDGTVTSLDFSAAPQPVGKFRKATLVEGTGARVTKGQTVAVRYLGQVYGGAAPFDENFSTAPTTFEIGTGAVIEGWDKNVVGSNVGSRILIEVPPKLGYGEAGNEAAGITGTDTLFFVIDILGAA